MADEHHQIKWVKRGSMSIHLGTLLNQKYQNIRASQVFNTYNTHTHTLGCMIITTQQTSNYLICTYLVHSVPMHCILVSEFRATKATVPSRLLGVVTFIIYFNVLYHPSDSQWKPVGLTTVVHRPKAELSITPGAGSRAIMTLRRTSRFQLL